MATVLFLGVPYRQRGADQPEHGKIFAYQNGRASIIAMRGREQDYYDLSEPSVSADGTVVAYVGRRECTTEPCPIELRESTIAGVPGAGGATACRHQATWRISMRFPSISGIAESSAMLNSSHPSKTFSNSSRQASRVLAFAQTPGMAGMLP
jgi:hypothetical protein